MELCADMNETLVDLRTIAACQEGDREAFRRLYDRCQAQVYSTALYFMSGNTAAAEDITQDVFVKLFGRIRQFRNDAAFSTWLHRMVVNSCMDELRRRKRFIDDPESSVPENRTDVEFDGDLIRAERNKEVRRALDGMSPKLRLPLLLKYFQDLSYEEMAKALDCSMGTIASRLNRGHKILARRLAHIHDAPDSGG